MPSFEQNLNTLFEDTVGANNYNIQELKSKLEAARKEVQTLEDQLKTASQRMNSELALGIKREEPGLNVGLDNTGCKVGYGGKNMLFNPDVESGIWVITPSELEPFDVMSPIPNLVKSIINHFNMHFESIEGNGLVLIEGKRSTTFDIMKYKDVRRKPINSRLSRRIK